ncbi:MAG: potassium-transporting ATPase subunit KdpC [Deltaproteobacteria bacterium]|nr:potassium-transporting ATPase subunit KdpC [Deltaproteobacteria bacterium]
MLQDLRAAVVLLGLFTVVCGAAYPLLMTGLAQVLLSHQANGSLVKRGDVVVGSSLIGQCTSGDRWFHGRPSATACNGMASSGSNLGPLNPALATAVGERVTAMTTAPTTATPIDLVTASGSGLDPHIAPESALLQVGRIAAARAMSEADLRLLVAAHVEERWLGILGERRVNVLLLNLALDAAGER